VLSRLSRSRTDRPGLRSRQLSRSCVRSAGIRGLHRPDHQHRAPNDRPACCACAPPHPSPSDRNGLRAPARVYSPIIPIVKVAQLLLAFGSSVWPSLLVHAVSVPVDPAPANAVATASVVRREPGATLLYSQNGPSALIPRSHCKKFSSRPSDVVTWTSSWELAGPRLLASILTVTTRPTFAWCGPVMRRMARSALGSCAATRCGAAIPMAAATRNPSTAKREMMGRSDCKKTPPEACAQRPSLGPFVAVCGFGHSEQGMHLALCPKGDRSIYLINLSNVNDS